ncbi:hypothetical protein Tco_1026169 [Tanacetum coccineum]
MVVQNQSELGEGSAMPTDPQHTYTFIQSSSQPQKTQKPRKPKRKDTQVPQPSGPTDIVADEAVHKELGDSLVRAADVLSYLHGYGVCRQSEYAILGIGQMRFLVKSWRRYAVYL